MEIKVFGPGCARCQETEKVVAAAVREADVTAVVEKVTDLKAMMAAGILSVPAVAIDGKMMCAGRVPAKDEVAGWINAAATSGAAPSCACGNGCCG